MFWMTLAFGTPLADVQQALSEGDCDRAATVAARWTETEPDAPSSWRALGDAHRCSGDSPAALAAYRASSSLQADAGLTALIGSMAAPFSSVAVSVEGSDPDIPVRLTVDGRVPIDGVIWDLPADTAMELQVGGAGYEAAVVPFTTGAAGAQTELAVTATFLGRGTLTVGAVGEGVSVLLDNAELARGDHDVLAGERVLSVTGPTGTMQHTVTLDADGSVTVEPMQLLPANVKLLKVPEGATLSFVSGPGEQAPVIVPRGAGELDETLGLSLEDVLLEGLPQGEWVYQMDHPILGTLEGRFFAVAGQLSAEPVPWRGLATVAPLEADYAAYKESSGPGFGKTGWMAVGLTTAALGTAGVGANRLQAAKAADASAEVYRERYFELNDAGNIEEANAQYTLLAEADADASKRRIIGVSSVGVAVLCTAGAAWTWKNFASSREVTAWNPWPEA
jgi:hypothetical protein